MRFIRNIIFIFIFLQLTAFSCFALISEKNIEPLRIESGARPLALGGSFVSVADDANAIFYNPAGLARSKGITLTLANAGGIVVGQAYPTGYGWTFGLAVNNSQLNNASYNSSKLSYYSNMLAASIGMRLSFLKFLPGGGIFENIDFGFTYKDILGLGLREEGLEDRSADGWDMDAGLLIRASDWVKIGAVFKNFLGEGEKAQYGGVLQWDNGSKEVFPASFKIGTSLKVIGDVKSPIYFEGNELTLSGDFDLPLRESRPTLFSFGAEWLNQGRFAGRVGFGQRLKDSQAITLFSCGVGYRILPWGFDLTYSPGIYPEDSIVYFSILYWPEEWVFVAKTKEELERERREKEEKKRKEEEKRRLEEIKRQLEEEEKRKAEEEKKKLEEQKKKIEEEKKQAVKPDELIEYIGGAEKLVTDSDEVEIEGKVKTGSRVYINGNDVFVGDDGKIKAKVPLSIGKNLIEIVVEYDGVKKIVQRQVLRQVKVKVAEEVVIEKEISRLKPEEERLEKEKKEIEKALEKKTLKPSEKKEIEKKKERIELEAKKIEEKKKKIEKEKKIIEEKKEKLINLATLGIIDLDPDKEYRLEEKLTRGELAMWLVRAKGYSLSKLDADPFKDVPKTHKYAYYIKAIVDAGIMSGYPDGTFKPDAFVTEAEGLEILSRL